MSILPAREVACAALSSATSEQPLKGGGAVAPLDHISILYIRTYETVPHSNLQQSTPVVHIGKKVLWVSLVQNTYKRI